MRSSLTLEKITPEIMAMTQTSLDATWKQWLASCMMHGADPAYLKEVLLKQGMPAHDAALAVEEVLNHPYVEAGRHVARMQKQLEWLLNIYQQVHRLSPQYGEIERRSGLTRETLIREYVSVNRPVVITDMAKDWTISERWTPDYLSEKFGDIVIEFQRYRHDGSQFELIKDHLPFKTFLAQLALIEEANDFYITAYNTHMHQALMDGLIADIDGTIPDYLDMADHQKKAFVWIGPAGTLTQLHFDLNNGLLHQIQGRKLVRMVPSYQLPYVYAERGTFSPVNPEKPDYQAYPLFQQVHMTEVILEPGDTLLIPVGWWHQVRALDRSISITFANTTFDNAYYGFTQLFPQLFDQGCGK